MPDILIHPETGECAAVDVHPPAVERLRRPPAQAAHTGPGVERRAARPPVLRLAAIRNRLRYPGVALRIGIEGRLFVQFVVDERGHVQDPVVIRGAGCDEEAVRVLRQVRFADGT